MYGTPCGIWGFVSLKKKKLGPLTCHLCWRMCPSLMAVVVSTDGDRTMASLSFSIEEYLVRNQWRMMDFLNFWHICNKLDPTLISLQALRKDSLLTLLICRFKVFFRFCRFYWTIASLSFPIEEYLVRNQWRMMTVFIAENMHQKCCSSDANEVSYDGWSPFYLLTCPLLTPKQPSLYSMHRRSIAHCGLLYIQQFNISLFLCN